MVRYFYAWTPLVVVFGTAVVLTIPYLALIVLAIAAPAALAALVWAIVAVPLMLGRAISRGWEHASPPVPRSAALAPARRQNAQAVFGKGHAA